MLKEFAQYLQSLKDNQTYTIHGETYSDHDLVRIKPHVDHPGCLRVTGLDSIVKLIRNELEMLEALPVYIRVDGAEAVSVFTSYDAYMDRDSLYCASCDVPGFREGFREPEQAIIELRSKFAPDEGVDYLLDLKKNRIALELMNVEGIGSSVANQMSDWINENRDFIEFLLKHMKIIDDRITYGNVVFTGFRNKEYADKFKDIGFPQHEKTTNDTVAVVYAGDVTSSNAKAALAKDIPLIHVAQLDDLYEELKKRDEELKNQEIKYGRYQLIRDIRAHVQCYRAV